MNERVFDHTNSIAIIIGVESYDKLYNSEGIEMFDDIKTAVEDVDVMEAGCKTLLFDEVQKYWEPTHKQLKEKFDELYTTLEKRNEENKKTVVFVYFSGQGMIDKRSYVALNDDDKSIQNAFMFPLESQLRRLAENPSNYVIGLYDCQRMRVPKEYRSNANEIDDEGFKNLIQIFGSAPSNAVRVKPQLARPFMLHCSTSRQRHGGKFTFPQDFIFFKTKDTKPEVATDNTHIMYFPRTCKKNLSFGARLASSNMAEALSQAFNKELAETKSKGTLTTDTCTYKGDIENGVATGQGTLTFTDGPSKGDVYTGAFVNNAFHGEGTYKFKEGKSTVSYQGQFTLGAITGKGKMTYSNGDVTEAIFSDGKANGQGTCRKYNGDVYEGNFINNFYHGKGKLTWQKGGYYDGDWKDGYATGKGTKVFQSADKYVGDFVNGKRDGEGECNYKSGNKYVGSWKQNRLEGYGTLNWANGDMYQGDWENSKKVNGYIKFADGGEHWAQYKDDKIEGPYKRKYPNGTILQGPVVNGKVNGPGSYLFTSGLVWEGNFKENLLQGNGYKIEKGIRYKVVFKDNKIESVGEDVSKLSSKGRLETETCWYEGDIVDGTALGQGVLVYTSGPNKDDRYEGQFTNNVFHGEGKYIFAKKQGRVQKEYNGKFLNGAMTGWGSMTYQNDDKAEAEFLNAKCFGQGKCWKYNGDLYEGAFKDNFYHGKGKLTYKAGGYYNGDWKMGFATGFGEKMFQSGDFYKGSFFKGKPNGYGECNYKNGNKYHGEWKSNTLSGQGTLFYSNGDVYTGTWMKNKRVKGHVKFKDGGEHWATYENEVLTGWYKRKYPNGTILEGPVVNGKINGQGFYLFPTTGIKWEGVFTDNFLQGSGFKCQNGVKHPVTFKDNKIVE